MQFLFKIKSTTLNKMMYLKVLHLTNPRQLQTLKFELGKILKKEIHQLLHRPDQLLAKNTEVDPGSSRILHQEIMYRYTRVFSFQLIRMVRPKLIAPTTGRFITHNNPSFC